MKKLLIKPQVLVAAATLGICVSLALFKTGQLEILPKPITEQDNLKKQYGEFLMEHPFRKSMSLTKSERLDLGIPPNKYFEQEYLYTSDPRLLRPAPERLSVLMQELSVNSNLKAPPGTDGNNWLERGPNNVGGRTHALMFAPGSNQRVFAGGVSGGLWINDNITSNSTVWRRVEGVPGNLAITSITVDPQDSNVMYIGTGEVYTWGAVNGNGIYKSTDGGENWVNIYSGGTTAEDKLTYVQDIIAWVNPSTGLTEVYFGADSMAYTEEVDANSGGAGFTFLGSNTIGLYRSTDGETFSRLTGSLYESSTGSYYAPNDFDIGADGKLWMGTKYSYYTGEGGGRVFSNDGTGWTLVRNLGDNGRIELACSQQNANKIYVLAEDRTDSGNPVKIYRTNNGFSTFPNSLNQPNDADTGIDATDFTRGQSFYDLLIGVDPNDDTTLYVGGIDLFKSTNSGNSWNQFSHWYGGFGYQEVHADHHGIAFSSSSRIIFGNDGGVYYTNNGGTNTFARNNGYNVTQFYRASINQSSATDILLAGAQDNGSHLVMSAGPGINSTVEITGGDGCYTFIDQDFQYMISSYVYNNYRYITNGGVYLGNFTSYNDGDFVNQTGLDSDTNVMLSNATSGSTYRIRRWAIDPSGPSFTTATLTNPALDAIPIAFTPSPHTSDRWLIGTALGKILRFDNMSTGSPSATDISIPGAIGAISDIRYGSSESDIMVTFHNYGVTSVWYTNNGNTANPSWVSKEGTLPDMPVKCILQNPLDADEVIIGTELGVWKTNDFSSNSPTWVQSQNGMSDVKVLSFDYRSSDRTILASTFGRGMFTGQFESNSCTATTIFSSNWDNGTPTSSRAAIIDTNYDTAVRGSIDACTLIVRSGTTLTVRAGDYLNIEGEIIIDGNLVVEHQGAVVQNSKDAIVTKNGTINVEITTPNLLRDDFMAMGSPMSGETTADAFGVGRKVMQHTPANFIANSSVGGATNFSDDNRNFWSNYSGGITAGEGYLVFPQTGVSGTVDMTFSQGTLNNGDFSRPMVYNGVGVNPNGTPNVYANPYASAISADDFLSANGLTDVYFWEHITAPNSGIPGPYANNYSMDDISIYNDLSGGLAAANDGGGTTQPNGIISTAQGFGVLATSGGSVTFTNSMRRTSGNTTLRTQDLELDRMWFRVSSDAYEYPLGSNTLIAYNPEATDGLDGGDTNRLDTSVSLYSTIRDTNKHLTIQSLEEFNEEDKISMGFSTLVETSLEYTIELTQVQGTQLGDRSIYLIDNLLGRITDLTQESYSFRSGPGDQPGRFTLAFEYQILETVQNELESIGLYPNPTDGILNITSPLSPITLVTIYDLQGRVVKRLSHSDNMLQLDLSELNTAMYMVQIKTETGQITKRLVKN